MIRTADPLLGGARQGWVTGGNLRLGREETLWPGRGKPAESNAAQVAFARKIVEDLGVEVAAPDKAREFPELTRGHDVKF